MIHLSLFAIRLSLFARKLLASTRKDRPARCGTAGRAGECRKAKSEWRKAAPGPHDICHSLRLTIGTNGHSRFGRSSFSTRGKPKQERKMSTAFAELPNTAPTRNFYVASTMGLTKKYGD